MRRYNLRKLQFMRVRVRAFGTGSYVTKDGMAGLCFADPRVFLSVHDAEEAFGKVAPKGWKPVVEPVPLELGIYGTGRLVSEDGQIA